MSGVVIEACHGTTITAVTGAAVNIVDGAGYMLGVFCCSTTAGSLAFTNAAGTTLVPAFSPTASVYHPIPKRFDTGLMMIVSGAITGVVFATPG